LKKLEVSVSYAPWQLVTAENIGTG